MKKTEKQHNAPPMPESRRKPTEAIAKHFHAVGIPCKGCSSTDHGLKALKKLTRQQQASMAAKPAGSRQEAKARAAEALVRHREEKGVQAHSAKLPVKPLPRLSALDRLRPTLPKKHSAERIDFAKRMYATRVEARKANQPTLLSDMRGSVNSSDPRPKGMERCELYFPQRGAVPVWY